MTTPPPPPLDALATLLDRCASFEPPSLVAEVRVFHAYSLTNVCEAAESIVAGTLPSPYWASTWPAGIALARALHDQPEIVQGSRVLDFGAGGGVASLAAACA